MSFLSFRKQFLYIYLKKYHFYKKKTDLLAILFFFHNMNRKDKRIKAVHYLLDELSM